METLAGKLSPSLQVQPPDEVGVARKGGGGAGEAGSSSMKLDWPTASLPLPAYVPGRLHDSPKMVVLFNLVFHTVHLGERILVFR